MFYHGRMSLDSLTAYAANHRFCVRLRFSGDRDGFTFTAICGDIEKSRGYVRGQDRMRAIDQVAGELLHELRHRAEVTELGKRPKPVRRDHW